jgi:ATP-dependent RNA helicase DDX5/DBP2
MSGYYTSSRESNSFQNSDHDGHSNLIRKNFYKEHPNVAKLSQMEVEKIRNDLGITIVGQNIPNPVTSFNEAGFPSSLIQTILNDPKFSCPTPIQSQGISYLAWPLALSGKDFIGIAQTGSGKTLAFVLPALVHICDQSPLSVIIT